MQQNMWFWIFMGVVFVAMIWAGSRERIEKQRTLQRMLERNEEIDEKLVSRLLGRRPFAEPGEAYRACRAVGAFGMVAAVPVGVIAAILVAAEHGPMSGVVVSGAVFFLMPFFAGLGLFLASNFFEKPAQRHESRP